MNEHEHHKPEGSEPEAALTPTAAPSPRVGTEAAGASEADTIRTVSLDDASRSRRPEYAETNVSVVREGIRRYGQPFLAYLILDGVEQRADDLVEQYEARSIGYFPDRRSFATWAIEDQGWNDELVELRHLQGMWPDDVKWNLDALWPEFLTRYALTERLGGVHAFRR